MFEFRFSINNPFAKSKADSINKSYSKFWRITKNKTFEFTVQKWNRFVIPFSIDINTRFDGFDHAGPWLVVHLWKFCLDIRIQDRRHWDYDKDEWIEAGEEKEIRYSSSRYDFF